VTCAFALHASGERRVAEPGRFAAGRRPFLEASSSPLPTQRREEPTVQEAPAPPAGFAAGDPALLGLPVFIAGSVALGTALIGYVSAAATGGTLPIIMMSTGIGLIIATAWALGRGQSAVAATFGVFSGFWLSFAALELGLGHGWYGVPTADQTHTVALFLITWLVVIGLLGLGTLRLPLAFTLLFLVVEVALALLLAGTIRNSADLTKASGYAVYGFAAVGAYLFLGAAAVATGGRALPLGRPIMR
jgi:succinate-acetate transporter protein